MESEDSDEEVGFLFAGAGRCGHIYLALWFHSLTAVARSLRVILMSTTNLAMMMMMVVEYHLHLMEGSPLLR